MTDGPPASADERRSLGARLVRGVAGVVAVVLVGAGLLLACGEDDDQRAFEDYIAFIEPRMDGEAEVWAKLAKWSERRQTGPRLDPPKYYAFLEGEALPFYERLVEDLVTRDPGLTTLQPTHRHLTEFAQHRLEFVRTEQRLGDTFRAGGEQLRALSEAEETAHGARSDYDRKARGLDWSYDGRYTRISLMWDDFHAVYLVRCLEGDLTMAELRRRIRDHVLVELEKIRHSRFTDDEAGRLLRPVVVSTIDYFQALDRALKVYVPSKRAAVYSEEQIQAGQKALAAFQEELERARAR